MHPIRGEPGSGTVACRLAGHVTAQSRGRLPRFAPQTRFLPRTPEGGRRSSLSPQLGKPFPRELSPPLSLSRGAMTKVALSVAADDVRAPAHGSRRFPAQPHGRAEGHVAGGAATSPRVAGDTQARPATPFQAAAVTRGRLFPGTAPASHLARGRPQGTHACKQLCFGCWTWKDEIVR